MTAPIPETVPAGDAEVEALRASLIEAMLPHIKDTMTNGQAIARINNVFERHAARKEANPMLFCVSEIATQVLGPAALTAAPAPAVKPQTWQGLDDARLQLAINAFYEPCEGTTIDGVRAAILAWEQSR